MINAISAAISGSHGSEPPRKPQTNLAPSNDVSSRTRKDDVNRSRVTKSGHNETPEGPNTSKRANVGTVEQHDSDDAILDQDLKGLPGYLERSSYGVFKMAMQGTGGLEQMVPQDLPSIVAIGEESAGKSATLER